MIGLPTRVTSRISSGAMPASAAASWSRPRIAARTAAVISRSPPGCIITYETRLMRSSPNRICGFIAPAEATTSPDESSLRCAAMVVEPTSTAAPYALSRKPGQTAMTSHPPCTATVIRHPPERRVVWRVSSTARSQRTSSTPHSSRNAASTLRRSPAGSCMSGGTASMKCSRTTGSTRIACTSARLRTTCRWTWLSGGDVDHHVAADLRRAAEAASGGERRTLVVVALLDRPEFGEVPGPGADAVLGEVADALHDLAAPADPPSAADRVEIHPERPGRVEDLRPGREPPPASRGREDDLRGAAPGVGVFSRHGDRWCAGSLHPRRR